MVPFKRKSLGRGEKGVKAESLSSAQRVFSKELVSENLYSISF